jgi:Bacterial virulence factor lipase N-terminal
MRVLPAVTLTVAALLLGACGSNSVSSGSTGIGPTDPTTGNGAGPTPLPTTFHPMFAVAEGIFPYPTDLYFVCSTPPCPAPDGTLRLPDLGPLSPNRAALNSIDGFSTTSPITVRFSAPIDATTLSPADVVVIGLTLDNATKGPYLPPAPGAQLPHALAYGTDYRAYVSGAGPAGALAEAVDGGGSVLVIEPVRPLDSSSGPINIGYIVLVTSGVKDVSGNPAVPDNDYATVKAGALADLAGGAHTPTCASITDPELNGVCRLTFGHLAIAAQGGLNPASVVVSFSFSTVSTSDTLNYLWASYQATPVAPGTIVAAPTPLTTQTVLGASFPGFADIWVGTVTVPYYLAPAANPHDPTPLATHWVAAGASPAPGIDPASRSLTRFNPVPAVNSQQTIPLLVGVPDPKTNCVEPATGWPVVVLQHGFSSKRSDTLTLFDAYTGHCFVVVAMDLPLHGITDPTNPFFHNQIFQGTAAAALMTGERTFDLDLENNTSFAPGPDGVIDPSGDAFYNSVGSPLTVRDDLRQATSDILWLAHVLPTLSLGVNKNGVSDVDPTQLQLTSLSLGGIVGIPALAVANPMTHAPSTPFLTGVASVSGSSFAYVARDSAGFGPRLNSQLKAVSGGAAVPGTTLYDNFFRDLENVLDTADPANYAAAAVASRPILIQQVVGGGVLPDSSLNLPDQGVPNSSTARLVAAGNFTRFTLGQALLPAGAGAYVNFIYGQHASLIDPRGTTNTGPTNLAAFAEMQTEAVAFSVARGQAVTVGAASAAVIQP